MANIDAGRVPLPNYASAQEHTSMVSRPSKEALHNVFLGQLLVGVCMIGSQCAVVIVKVDWLPS